MDLIPGNKDGEFEMYCEYPNIKGPDGKPYRIITEKMLFWGKICTECMVETSQTMFKLVDAQLQKEKELEDKKKEKEKAKKDKEGE